VVQLPTIAAILADAVVAWACSAVCEVDTVTVVAALPITAVAVRFTQLLLVADATAVALQFMRLPWMLLQPMAMEMATLLLLQMQVPTASKALWLIPTPSLFATLDIATK
jgi:hypothetical protein